MENQNSFMIDIDKIASNRMDDFVEKAEDNVDTWSSNDAVEKEDLDLPAFDTFSVPDKPAPSTPHKFSCDEQATMVLQNWIDTHPNTYLAGPQKRTLYRQFLRLAKKGTYEHIFNKTE